MSAIGDIHEVEFVEIAVDQPVFRKSDDPSV